MKTILIDVHHKGDGSEILAALKGHPGFEISAVFPIGNRYPANPHLLILLCSFEARSGLNANNAP
jgi:hypothetical protein